MRKAKTTAFLAAGLGLVPAVMASSLSLDLILRPFEYLDLAYIYSRYSAIIDLFIFILIFVGVTQVTLAKRFPGRGGRAITIGTGLVLAFSMILAEETLGFNIKSFGPLAAFILVLLLGIVIYQLLHQVGLTRLRAAALAYIVIFFSMLAIVPNFFSWIDERMPFLSVISIMALLLAAVALISRVWATGSGSHAFKEKLRHARSKEPERKRQRDAVDKESRFIKHRIRPIAKKASKDSETILKDLELIEEAIRKYGHIPEERKVILAQIDKIFPKEHDLQRSIQILRNLNEKLLRFDTSLFSEKSCQRLKEMSHEEKKALKKELRDEIERMGLEKKAIQIEEALEQHIRKVARYLSAAASAIRDGQIEEARNAIGSAIASEKEISEHAKEIKRLERNLLSLAKRDLRIEKRLNPS